MSRRALKTALAAAGALAIGAPAIADVSELEIEPVASLSPNSAAVIVTGTIVCSPGEFAYVQVGVTQAWAHGQGWSETVACDGASQEWAARVQSREGTFHHGRASASADATTFTEEAVTTGGLVAPQRMIRIANAQS